MAFKPFRPPSLKPSSSVHLSEPQQDSEYPSKRRKLSEPHLSHSTRSDADASDSSERFPSRKPLRILQNASSPDHSTNNVKNGESSAYFSALWRKSSQKKHKTWDDDGFVSIRDSQAILYDGKGKFLGHGKFSASPDSGVEFSLSGKDIELGETMTRREFATAIGLSVPVEGNGKHDRKNDSDSNEPRQEIPLTLKGKTLREQMQSQITRGNNKHGADDNKHLLGSTRHMPFKQPMKESTILPQIPSEKPIPRHDPGLPNALVFQRPRKVPAGHQIVDVVLDPLLSKQLREHQKAGIEFLYECVMDLRNSGGQGCILADDMGLGKTLQTIALIWTLIKQNPIYRAEPVIKKALIVCPVTLIQNWKKEFRKWLGRDKLGVLTLEDKGSRLSMFDGKNFKVLIIGYEKLRTIAEDLTRGAGIDIVICDEGHRLKTLKNKSAKAIETFNTPKRVILSGTPIQNDLSEFFAMVNFVNDGCLGSYKSFVRDFENPIMKSRQPNATEEDLANGKRASEELAQATSPFILRRTAAVLAKYLPPRTEYVLFCNPTPEQARVYREVLKSPMFDSALGNHESALQLITILKKLCNSPALIRPDRGNDESTPSGSLSTLNEMLPAGLARLYHNSFSSKIRLLDELLHQIRQTTDDKVILVSNYTSTLNLMANLLDSSGGRYLRLDGSVPQSKRQGLVDEFNRASASVYFAFLLSAKAGGVGLNLIGANRLILFDVDWNPATDDQAMARIHREGQQKHCKIYRFLIKGGLEERIWQRQVVKRGLANSIMGGTDGQSHGTDVGSSSRKSQAAFSKEELRDLFRLDERASSQTHDLIGCKCGGRGDVSVTDPATIQETIGEDGCTDHDQRTPGHIRRPRDIVRASDLTHVNLENSEDKVLPKSETRHKMINQRVTRHELMLYSHLDTASVADLQNNMNNSDTLSKIEEVVDDSCLMQILKHDSDIITGRIAYVFKKSTQSEVNSRDDIGEITAQ